MTAGVAGRYATALFELGRENGTLDKVEADLAALEAALAESPDLRQLVGSAAFTRDEQGAGFGALAERMGPGPEVTNTVGVMAANRRLFVLPGMIAAVKGLIAEARGEIAAEVRAAAPLTEGQEEELAETLRRSFGKDVRLDIAIDERLIGGLVVKVGSRMIDTTIRSQLANMQNIMKEVG
ncbi:F0F1 ATP synthase subunit delta [soil metagenome]